MKRPQVSKMETIANNPGLQHLTEKVFWNLIVEDLKMCSQINQSCKQMLENSLSKVKQKYLLKVIESEKNLEKDSIRI